MELKFWFDRWETNNIGFHQAEVEPNLVKYFAGQKPGTVFVPLCGKSKDLIWLARQGWRVIGVEASPIACQALFEENEISFSTRQTRDHIIYEGGNISVWCGDFFSFPQDEVSTVTSVYDRAALIALPSDLREKYAKQMISFFADRKVLTLLIVLEYDQSRADGPPFSIDAKEIERLYFKAFKITHLTSEEDPEILSPKFTGIRVVESVYRLEPI